MYGQILEFGPKNSSAIDWDAICQVLSSDIFSKDEQLQISALNLLKIIPLENSMLFITSNEQLISVFF